MTVHLLLYLPNGQWRWSKIGRDTLPVTGQVADHLGIPFRRTDPIPQSVEHLAFSLECCNEIRAEILWTAYVILHFFTPPRNRGGVIFLLQFVYVSVCLSVCLEFL